MKNKTILNAMMMLSYLLAGRLAIAENLYQTSFESVAVGKFKQITADSVKWTSLGKAEITNKYHHHGKNG